MQLFKLLSLLYWATCLPILIASADIFIAIVAIGSTRIPMVIASAAFQIAIMPNVTGSEAVETVCMAISATSMPILTASWLL